MRGADTFTESLFTMLRLVDFVAQNHPLRPVRKMVNQPLKNIEPLLSGMYAADIKGGRPSSRLAAVQDFGQRGLCRFAVLQIHF